MRSLIFRIRIEPDVLPDGSTAFQATCPALKGCHSWGRTTEEALSNIREAVELYIDDLTAEGEQFSRLSNDKVIAAAY